MEAAKPDKQDESVNVTSVTGLDPVAVAPSLGSGNGLLNQPDRRRAAERLREKGWSYRRIAEDLGVPYILVSKWLSGDPAVPDTPPQLRTEAKPRVSDTPAAAPGEGQDPADTIDTLKLQYAALERYMLPMMEALERSRLADADGAETRAREATERRIAELEAAVAALQDQVRSMAAGAAAAGTAVVAAVAATAATEAADPFAGEPDPFVEATPDPFEDMPDPFATAAAATLAVEPAAVDPFAEVLDPFAAVPDPDPEPAVDPFAEAAADPFDPPSVPAPFAEAEVDPFAEASDPLAVASVAGSARPEADLEIDLEPAATPFVDTEADPFATPAIPDPFAEPGTSDPFADTADPFADTAADPFATAPDPFAQPQAPDPLDAPPADPFGEPEPPAPKSLGARLKFWKR